MHSLFTKADQLSHRAIGAAIEVHSVQGAGLLEGIYEKCMLRELELRNIPAVNQQAGCHEGKAGDRPEVPGAVHARTLFIPKESRF